MADKEVFDIRGLDYVYKMLNTLPAEVVSKRGGPVKLALAKGARVIRDQARKNVDQITAGSSRSTGQLRKAIRVTRGKYTGGVGEKYLVWTGSAKRATRRRRKEILKGKQIEVKEALPPQFYGKFQEAGTSTGVPAAHWLRKAFLAKRDAAVSTIQNDLIRRVIKLAEKQLAPTRGLR